MLVGIAGTTACGPAVPQIDLRDQTIPIEARTLVADAEDAVALARARHDELQRELESTREWRRELMNRDWPSDANEAVRQLDRFAEARIELARLRVERADEEIDLARAKYQLISAKTAVRHDLGIYKLDPLRERLEAREADVNEVEKALSRQRRRVAKRADQWWSAFRSLARDDGETRALYVEAVREMSHVKLRTPSSSKEGAQQEDSESESSEAAPDLEDIQDTQQEGDSESSEDE